MQLLSPSTKRLLQNGLDWYRGLKARERWMLLGLAVVLVFLGGQRVYQVYQAHKEELVMRMETAQNNLLWLEESRLQLARLGNQGVVELSEQQLLDTLGKLAEELGITVELSDVEVDKRPFVRVTWKGKNLSRFMHYLSALTQRGANVKSLQVTRGGGSLTARAQLEG